MPCRGRKQLATVGCRDVKHESASNSCLARKGGINDSYCVGVGVGTVDGGAGDVGRLPTMVETRVASNKGS